MENVPVILPKLFSGFPELKSGMSTRLGSRSRTGFEMNLSLNVGDDPSAVMENRKRFFSQVGVKVDRLAVPLQCHSNEVFKADLPGEYQKCDALITNLRNVALAITVADCVPVLLFDPIRHAVGAVHAGWKGTAHSIVERAITKMKEEYGTNPENLLVFVGPSAGSCCYEVGEEVAVMFRKKIVPYGTGKILLDLKEENRRQLQHQGIPAGNIEVNESCTICEKEMFHSYRRDGARSGRMMAVICII
jgi:polyphenol oxidase